MQIRVDEKVHKQVKKIADANFRGIGDQIAYWAAKECPHPDNMRSPMEAQVSLPDKDGKFSDNQTVSVFYCHQCRQLVWNGATIRLTEKIRELVES